MRPAGHSGAVNGRGRRSSSEVAFDLWLERGLHAMYDDVAKEPIPPELLALIQQDKAGE
jgi:hypothetical protein